MTRASFPPPAMFRSFWLGGFQSASRVTRARRPLDMLAATQHDRLVDDDYARLAGVGIHAVRDAVRWPLVEVVPGAYDFRSVAPFVAAARRHGVQVVWDLASHGWPADLDVLAPGFVDRFAGLCRAVARYLRAHSDEVPCYAPISGIAAVSRAWGDDPGARGGVRGRGPEATRQLVRAWIAGVEALRAVDARARVISVEPLLHTVPPRGRADVGGVAARRRERQWEAWELIAGLREPELGGASRYLDTLGVAFRADHEWEVPGGATLPWHGQPRDPRWRPLHDLLREAYDRFRRPILVAETGHAGSARADWLREVTDEVALAVADGVPLQGVCLDPIVDRLEWHDPTRWHHGGLWDVRAEPDGTLTRVLDEGYASELARCRRRLARLGLGDHRLLRASA